MEYEITDKTTVDDICKNLKQIGGGFRASVFELSPTKVVRISLTELDGWRVITRLSPNVRKRLKLPMVYKTWVCPLTKMEISIVEKLFIIPRELTWDKESVNLETLNTHFVLPDVDVLVKPTDHFYQICKDAVRLLKYVRRIGYDIVSLDMNYANIMMNVDGEFVLNDCLGSIDFG